MAKRSQSDLKSSKSEAKSIKHMSINSKNTQKDWYIGTIRLFGGQMERVLDVIATYWSTKLWVEKGKYVGGKQVATVNPEFVMLARQDHDFRRVLERSSMNVLDGVTLWWIREIQQQSGVVSTIFTASRSPRHGGENSACKKIDTPKRVMLVLRNLWYGWRAGVRVLRGEHVADMVPGSVLVDRLCGQAERLGKTVFFLGGWGDSAQKTAEYFNKKYPKLIVAGWYGGKRANEFDNKTVSAISRLLTVNRKLSTVDMLFVAYGMGEQEKWITRNLSKLPVKVAMGVGRTFDYYGGAVKMVPSWMRRMGLEWVWSLTQPGGRERLRRQKAIWRLVQEAIFY